MKMHIEYECTLLEVDKKRLEEKLTFIGAEKIGDYTQKRYTYDFNPKLDSKWIRLRTNGKKSTLTIKNVVDKTVIGGTQELEIEVSDFEMTNLILEEMGYMHRNYQENTRTLYKIGDVEVSIDKWPMIPEYAEIEGKTEEEVKNVIEQLNVDYKITNLDVSSIYEQIYGIDILKIKDLKFDNRLDNVDKM
jgi:adenylate cyclase class 2